MEYVKAFFRRVYEIMIKYPLAAAGTVALVLAAVFLTIFGKKFQVGGLIGKLWGSGKKDGPDVRVIPKKERVDENGNPIMPGESDEKGYVQPTSTKIKKPGIFDDPDVIVVEHPDKGKVKLPLPTGVKNSDVEEVLEIAPDVYEVRNNDKGVDVDKLLEEI